MNSIYKSIIKTIILFSFFTMTLNVSAQVVDSKYDKFDKVSRLSFQKQQITNIDWTHYGIYFEMNLVESSGYKVVYIIYEQTVYQSYCFTGSSYIKFLLEDDSTVELKYSGKVECESRGTLYGKFLLTDDNISKLSNKKIKEMRVLYSDGYYDYKVNQKHSDDYFIKNLGLIGK